MSSSAFIQAIAHDVAATRMRFAEFTKKRQDHQYRMRVSRAVAHELHVCLCSPVCLAAGGCVGLQVIDLHL